MSRTQRFLSSAVVLSLLWLVIPRPLHAGDDWLPVPPEDLSRKDNPKQAGADAMVLYRQVDVDAKEASVNNYIRIKVFTQQGVKDEADVELPYDKAEESIQGVRARTIRPDGSIAVFDGKPFDKEIVKGNGIKYLAKTFTMPDVQPGSIIEYKYREQYDDRYYWSLGWTVQYNLFTRMARFSIKPNDSVYSLPLRSRFYNLTTSMAVQKQTNNQYSLEIHDLPGVEEEPLMPAARTLQARVEFYYQNQDEPSNETMEQYWKRMGKQWNNDVDHFVDKKKELAAEVSQDVNSSDPPEIKLRKLYARALKIRNLDFENAKTRKEQKQEQLKPNNNVEDLLKHGYGHNLEVNFLLIGLARAAGFEAADVRLASREHTVFYPQRQAASDLNAEIVWIRAGSKEYYLDPAAHYYPFGVLPWHETAVNGMRVTKEGCENISTPPSAETDATIMRHADLTFTSAMEISGKLQIDFSGVEAAYRRIENRDEDEAGRKKIFQDEIKGWLPTGATFVLTDLTHWDEVEQPIHVEGNVTIPSFTSTAIQRLLVPMEIFRTTEVGNFQSQKRVNVITFAYPYEQRDDLVIHPPAGYKVQAVPAAQIINPGPVSYEISAVQQTDSVEVKRRLTVKGIFYPKESYLALRNFFSVVRTNDNAQILFQSSQPAKSN